MAGLHLHPISQLETLDARQQIRFALVLFEVAGIDLLQEIELRPLVVWRDVLGPNEVENGRARRTEKSALVAGREKARAPVERAAFHALIVAQHNIPWKV